MKNNTELVEFIEREFNLVPTQYKIEQGRRSWEKIHVVIAISNTLVDVALSSRYYKYLKDNEVGLAIDNAITAAKRQL